jgi:hypothetical protein
MPHPKNDASFETIIDAVSSLLFFASECSIGGSHMGDELERVLETPPE